MKFFSLIVVCFVVMFTSSSFAYVLPEDDSRAPYFYIFGPQGEATYGANKESDSLVFYIDVPEEENRGLLISLYDPDTGGMRDFRVSADNPWDTVTKFSVYGSSLLQEEEFGGIGYDRSWFTFGPYLPQQGEKINEVYRFKLVATTLQGDDANLFKIKIEPETAEVFSYEFTVRLVSEEGKKMYFYPQIPQGAREILVENYDLDPDGGTGILYDPLTMRHYKIKDSDTAQWAQTKVSLISESSRSLEYIITKGTQRKAHAGFRVKDVGGNLLPIYFKKGMPRKMVVILKQPAEEKPVCNTFTFDARESYDPGNLKLSYLWDFGDGETSDEPIVTHTYKEAGTYKVTLKVKNDSGLECDTAVTTETVRVNTPPQAVFEAPEIACKGETIIFDASATTDNTPETLKYLWDFGDGTKGEGKRITKSYDKGGKYKVTLIVDDNEGTACSKGNFSKMVKINTAPILDAGKDVELLLGPEEEYKVNFDGSKSYDPDGDAIIYRWDFGDGETGYGAKVTHVYKKGGKYTVHLTVDDGKGSSCSKAEDTLNVSLNKSPLADAGENFVCCVGVENIFDASHSYDPDGDSLSYHWDFGDGERAEGVKVKHVYTKPGTYNVVLTVKDAAGLSSVDSFMVSVRGTPIPSLKIR